MKTEIYEMTYDLFIQDLFLLVKINWFSFYIFSDSYRNHRESEMHQPNYKRPQFMYTMYQKP